MTTGVACSVDLAACDLPRQRHGRWRFDFDRYVGGQRLRKDRLLPAGWRRAQADAFDTKESAALLAIASGIAKPRRTIDEAVTRYKRHRIGESDPGSRMVTPVVRNARQVVIDSAQTVALARACRHRGVRALIRIALYSGMRAVRVGAAFVVADTKNGQPHLVPMHYRVLGAARVPMPKRSDIDYHWPLARAACSLKHVTLRDVRHSAANAMINAGEDLATVGAVRGRSTGRKCAASTKRYSHRGTERLAAAVAEIGKR
jgi:hypothetical protein